jgi:hypothetical protein
MNKREIIKKLVAVRAKAIRNTNCHRIDYNWKEWNDAVDGLDYALKLLRQ